MSNPNPPTYDGTVVPPGQLAEAMAGLSGSVGRFEYPEIQDPNLTGLGQGGMGGPGQGEMDGLGQGGMVGPGQGGMDGLGQGGMGSDPLQNALQDMGQQMQNTADMSNAATEAAHDNPAAQQQLGEQQQNLAENLNQMQEAVESLPPDDHSGLMGILHKISELFHNFASWIKETFCKLIGKDTEKSQELQDMASQVQGGAPDDQQLGPSGQQTQEGAVPSGPQNTAQQGGGPAMPPFPQQQMGGQQQIGMQPGQEPELQGQDPEGPRGPGR